MPARGGVAVVMGGVGRVIILPIRETGQCGEERVLQAMGQFGMGRTGLEEPALGSVPAGVVFGLANAANAH